MVPYERIPMDYTTPTVVDYGDLAELTAQLSTGGHTDAQFPQNTPFNQLTFS
jgi:hypothetical protein